MLTITAIYYSYIYLCIVTSINYMFSRSTQDIKLNQHNYYKLLYILENLAKK